MGGLPRLTVLLLIFYGAKPSHAEQGGGTTSSLIPCFDSGDTYRTLNDERSGVNESWPYVVTFEASVPSDFNISQSCEIVFGVRPPSEPKRGTGI